MRTNKAFNLLTSLSERQQKHPISDKDFRPFKELWYEWEDGKYIFYAWATRYGASNQDINGWEACSEKFHKSNENSFTVDFFYGALVLLRLSILRNPLRRNYFYQFEDTIIKKFILQWKSHIWLKKIGFILNYEINVNNSNGSHANKDLEGKIPLRT